MEQPKPSAAHPQSVEGRGKRRIKQGRVTSNKMAKTIVVVSEARVPHATYGKIVRKTVRFKAHDERNEANVGDVVRIVPNHVCVVVNMMDEVVMVRGETIVGLLPVAARGKLR